MRIRLHTVCLVLLASIGLSQRAAARQDSPSLCEELLAVRAAALAPAGPLRFVLRDFDHATLLVQAHVGRIPPRALTGVDGIEIPAERVHWHQGRVSLVIAGAPAALERQIEDLRLQFGEVSFAVVDGRGAGAPLAFAIESTPVKVRGESGASLHRALIGRTGRSWWIDHVGLDESFVAFDAERFAALDHSILTSLGIREIDAPLAKLKTLEDSSEAWIVRGPEHVVASEAAALAIMNLVAVDQQHRSDRLDQSLRQKLDECFGPKCVIPAPLPRHLKTAAEVLEYWAEPMGIDLQRDFAADEILARLHAQYLPGRAHMKDLRFNDAAMVMNSRYDLQPAKARVMRAWTRFLNKVKENPSNAPVPAAPAEPVIEIPSPVAPAAVAPVPEPEAPAPAPPAQVAVTKVWKVPFEPEPLQPDEVDAIFSFLRTHKVTRGLGTLNGVRNAFTDVIFQMRRVLTKADAQMWRERLAEVPFGATDYAKARSRDPKALRALRRGWRIVQAALQDPNVDRAISVESVARTEVIFQQRTLDVGFKITTSSPTAPRGTR